MKLKGRIYGIFPVKIDINDNGELGECFVTDSILNSKLFSWLFTLITWLHNLAWWREDEEPQFEISISGVDISRFEEKSKRKICDL